MTNEAQATPKGPTQKQALLLLVAGFVLGLGGCATFMLESARSRLLVFIGASAYISGVAMFVTGTVWLIVRLVRAIAQSGRR